MRAGGTAASEMGSPQRRQILACLALTGLAWVSATGAVQAQAEAEVGRTAALGLRFEELRFDPPAVQKRTLDSGVTVFLLEDHSLPLVTLYVRAKGGYALLPRSDYAAASALPGLLRSGGTATLTPDSVDYLLDYYALQTTFGGGGHSTFSSVNTLSRHLDPAVELWGDMLANPGFDSLDVEVWRDRQLDAIRRRVDNPGLLAVSEFNQIMFGDHPIGWEMDADDLAAERFNRKALRQVYSRIFCPDNLIMGVVGDVSWNRVKPLLESMVSRWPECSAPLQEPLTPTIRDGRTVFLIPKDLTQSTIVIAGPGGVRMGSDTDYFASRIGNSILGGGGFSSRLLARVRTDLGYAYSASSFWTTPANYQGIVGVTTQTRSDATVEVAQLMLEIIDEMAQNPPSREEMDRVVSQIANSFIFNFQDPAQIVSRQISYQAQGLPEDWLQRYLRGIQAVDAEEVQRAFRRHVAPDDMIILILGNPEDFTTDPGVLGEVRIWEVGGPAEDLTEPRREGQRSRR